MDIDFIFQLFEVCIIPLLGLLTARFITYLNAKKEQIKQQTQNAITHKYLDMLIDTVSRCVIATNQTYVDTLKKQGKFNEEAQSAAFQMTLLSVSSILTTDAKMYIQQITNDLDAYLTQLIEAEVAKNKKGRTD